MYYENKPMPSYRSTLISLSVLSVISALGCSLLGYILLPFAAAMYASLLYFESKGRILSYIIPVLMFVFNFFLNGFYSLEGVAYVAIGAMLYFFYSKKVSKGEAVFYMSVATVAFMAFSFMFIAFDSIGALRFSAITEYYGEIYRVSKETIVDFLASFNVMDEDGVVRALYNHSEAEALFFVVLKSLIPALIISAFIIVGFTCKLFAWKVLRYSDSKEQIVSWSFKTSNFVAYFYLILSIISLFAANGLFADVIWILASVFSFVFAYLGAKLFYYGFASRGKGRFAIMIIVFGIFFFDSIVITVLSYIGVYFAIMSNKSENQKKNQ